MIQDIYPSRLDNSFTDLKINNTDTLMIFNEEGKLLVDTQSGEIRFPSGKEAAGLKNIYAFSVDKSAIL